MGHDSITGYTYTCQLFLSHRHEIFILGVPGFSKTTQTYPKIPEDIQKLPKIAEAETALTFPVPVSGHVSLNMTSLPVLSI